MPGKTKDSAKVGMTKDSHGPSRGHTDKMPKGKPPMNAPMVPMKKAPKLGPKSSGGKTDGSST